jgi:chromosome segregation ATPase
LEAARAHLEQQRDHLSAERDRVSAERDRVSAERDAANAETSRMAVELTHAHGDIMLLHDQRALVQAELVKITHECTALQTELERRTQQRNLLRDRVRALESSRAVRIAARLRKILRRG